MLAYCYTCNQQILPGEAVATQHAKPVHLRCLSNRPTYQEPWDSGTTSSERSAEPKDDVSMTGC